MARKIEPQFTKTQAGMVRVALHEILEGPVDGPDRRAANNALKELNRAQRDAEAGKTASHEHRPMKGTRNRLTDTTVEYLCRDCNAYYVKTEAPNAR